MPNVQRLTTLRLTSNVKRLTTYAYRLTFNV